MVQSELIAQRDNPADVLQPPLISLLSVIGERMETVVLVMDESGAKGYSDKQESFPGELGVMAGFLLPEKHLACVSDDLNLIRDKYVLAKKCHITDLPPKDQSCLRSDIFDYFKLRHIFWVYEATYVEGLHQHSESLKKLVTETKHDRKSKIKVSTKIRNDSLHIKLFLGAFGKGLSLAMDLVGPDLHVKVITDQVDSKLLKMFNTEACHLLHVGEPKTSVVTGFDSESKQLFRGTIKSEVTSGSEVLGDLSKVTYSISCTDSSLTFAADVVANSVHHHLKSWQQQSVGQALNSIEAIKGHVLAELVYGTYDAAQAPWITDAMYMHPNLWDK